MAKILFRLRHVPDEEADAVRQLLDQNAIDWFETSAGRFQISFPAIWLRDESQEEKAKELLAEFQQQHTAKMRAEHEAMGEAETFYQRLMSRPLPAVLVLLAVIFILYLSINPFLSLVVQQ